MASNSILAKLAVQISANTAEFNKKLAESNNNFSKFTGSLNKLAGALGVAFSVKEISQFAFEAAKLAGEAEGVEAAFDRLPNSTALMNELRDATHDTVSELELMKRSVQAANFGISLEALPKLLEFAALRAQQTGQSVDYLVDSIITGIGRKSPLILDNLGISAVALKEKLGDVSVAAASVGDVADAVGKIASDQLEQMGEFSENTATSVQSLSAAWEGLTVAVGNFLNKSGFAEGVEEIADVFRFFSGEYKLTKKEVDSAIRQLYALREAAKQAGDQKEVVRLTQYIADLASAYGLLKDKPIEEVNKAQQDLTRTLEVLKAELDDLNKQFETTDIKDKRELKNIGDKIIALQEQIKTLEALKKAQKEVPGFNLDDLGFFDKIKAAADNVNFDDKAISIPIDIQLDPEGTEEFDAAVEQVRERLEQQAFLLQSAASSMSSAFESAITGQQKFAQALGNITLDIIDLYLKQALAAALAKAFQTPGTPLPIALLAAAASIGIIRGLFRKAVGGSGGGGGGVSSGVRDSRPSVSGTARDSKPVVVQVEGQLKGNDIFLSMRNTIAQNRTTRR